MLPGQARKGFDTMKTTDLIEQRASVLARAKTAHEADDATAFAAAETELRAINDKLARAELLDAAERQEAGKPIVGTPAPGIECRAFANVRSPLPAKFDGQLWRTPEGLAVPALAPTDKLSDFVPASESRAGELGLGGFLRVLNGGAQTELERRVLAEGTIGAGGAIVPTPIAAGVLDLMRSKTVSIQAGARTVPMDSQTLKIARQTTDPVGGWRAENAAIAESDPVFDQVTLTAKTWAVRFNVSRELLEDGQNTDAALRGILASAAAVGLDQAILVGSGTSNQPLGIRGQSGIQAVSMGTNGAQLTNWTQPLNAVQALETANAGIVSAMVMAPRSARAIYGFVDSTGQPLMPPPRVANVPVLVSTSVPINEVQGTSGAVASSIFMGDFSEVLIGLRTSLQIQVLSERFAEVGQIGFIAWMRADVALARPGAIARIAGIIP
jgi:HK97 family phage major capsid protein